VNLASGRANDGQGGTDTLISIEQVRGTAGNDTIIGDGVDNIFRGNAGSDSLDGGAGTGDVADYAFATAAVSVNLTTGRANDGQGGTDTLANIERVWGSAFADTLIGGAGNDVLRGNAGNDSINGGAGSADVADYRNATTGISVNMATGVVQDGQGGNDTLNGIEQIWGSTFNDSMLGGNSSDFFVGSSGADTFSGGSGIDSVSYALNPANSTTATQGVSVNLTTGAGRDGYGGAESLVHGQARPRRCGCGPGL
jgi:Ca2+-binding RTX toxin-like protein